jgi:hypothetical protein
MSAHPDQVFADLVASDPSLCEFFGWEWAYCFNNGHEAFAFMKAVHARGFQAGRLGSCVSSDCTPEVAGRLWQAMMAEHGYDGYAVRRSFA